MSEQTGHDVEHGHGDLSFLQKYIFSTDHKIIGIQFLFTGLIFLFLGGFLALGVRTQLGWPHAEIPAQPPGGSPVVRDGDDRREVGRHPAQRGQRRREPVPAAERDNSGGTGALPRGR